MAALKFASSHNMVAFLDKSTESDGFEQIVDFLNAHPIKYALTVNPTIYTACIEQFWTTAKVQTVNGEVQIQALVEKKKVIITETSIRRDLQLVDENCTECLPNATIFAELERMGDSIEPIADEAPNDENVTTYSNDPLLSGEDRLKLNKLMELCTNLSQRVLNLENIKTSQAAEITKLKEGVKKLERRNKSRSLGLKRLRKTLIEIKAAKPKAVTTAATTTTTTVTRPKARGVVVQEPSEFTTTSPSQPSQLP
ncbi:hypothetical protein Tco_0475234 [Tanacetum coccineum]